jgi:cbb3-type cytochrome oxidase subunit 3
VLDVLAGLLPTIALGALFYVVIRAILQADRRERAAQARMEAEERRAGERDASPS